EPEPEPAAPAQVVDVPWATAEVPEPAVAPAQPVVAPQPEPVALPTAAVVEAAASEAVPLVVEADGGDDEPPPGDYDYVEMDAETLDYDFGQPEAETPVIEEPLPAAKPATGLAAEWLSLFPQLGLGGMTGSIAANCTLIEANGDDWLLHLDPAHSALFNTTQQRRLNEALNQQQGRSIKLRIELCKPEQETPAQAAARRRAERQRSAEASIQADPLVQQMIQQFAAKVRDDSIEPIDTPS
ncbi:DNA polymerase III subunit gamma/tau C-terminal domain-containing protein, partial [Pseudomonas sp. UBA7530]